MSFHVHARAKPASSPAPSVAPAAARLRARTCTCGGVVGATGDCIKCLNKRLAWKGAAQSAPVEVAPPVVREVLNSAGSPLDGETRAAMEAHFGYNFGSVRVHTGTRAGESAEAVGARAYTVGHDIAFAPGQHSPVTAWGRRVLAHELAHVVQQSGAGGSALATAPGNSIGVASKHDSLECDANAMTLAAPARLSIDVAQPSQMSLQRLPQDIWTPMDATRDGTTLPHHEANELLECIRIMGEENRRYCREEVLGEAPPRPEALTSTPEQADATILPDGSQRLRVGNTEVLILPDLTNQPGVEAGETSGRLELHPPQFNVPYKANAAGRITSFTPPRPRVTVTIQTRYAPGVAASAQSAYGRGTTRADIEAGNTSLGFHEGQHGVLYVEFLRTHRFPIFRGRRGMTVAAFERAVRDYEADIRAFGAALNRFSLERGDCVGTTIDQYRQARDPDWQPVCPARARRP